MKPKSWAEVNQRRVATEHIEWDGEIDEAEIEIPLLRQPVLIAIDNFPDVVMTVTLEHLIRIDPTSATAQIGEGDNGVITITSVLTGADANELQVQVVVPEVEEATDLDVSFDDQMLTVELGMVADGVGGFEPDDTKNTATLIAEAIDALEEFGASASGNGSTPIDSEIEPVDFTGGLTERWAALHNSEGTALEITVPGQTRRVYGPFGHFPRFLGGKIKVDAATAPASGETVVQVIEGG